MTSCDTERSNSWPQCFETHIWKTAGDRDSVPKYHQ